MVWCAGNAIHIVNGGTACAQNIGIMFSNDLINIFDILYSQLLLKV